MRGDAGLRPALQPVDDKDDQERCHQHDDGDRGGVRIAEFRFYVVALALQHRTGGSLAETLTNLSHVIRRRKELRLKVRAFTAEAKMSVIVLSALPFVAGGLMAVINHDLMVTLFTDPRGRFMVGLALASLLSGVAVMTWMIKKSLR